MREKIFDCFLKFQKSFDWVNREFLEYELIFCGVVGKFYNDIKGLYRALVPCLHVSKFQTGWFPIPFGVKQGDVLTHVLFVPYVNNLTQQIKQANLDILIDSMNFGIYYMLIT